ncbi:MAG: VOC family protein [Acidobacteriota bacterium]|nr:VOC family protein [Acidobacteriota bacterium]MDH3786236.1 VOC family protein [Acidobacteriota bacterium]
MTTPHLYRIILPVADIEKAAQFYSAVLESDGERISPGRHYFDCGGTILACYDPQADGDPVGDGWRFHENQYLYFSVADLDAVHARIETAGGRVLSGVETMPWGERMFYAEDPFGSRISFVEEGTLFTGADVKDQ